MNVPELIQGKPILLFDGYCNLCSSTVQFILKHEKGSALFFGSLQSDAGKAILDHFHIDSATTDSLVFIEHEKSYVKSSAALRVSRYLKGLYPTAFGMIIIPPFIRNAVYDYIARHRYKWYGQSESCMVPEKKWTDRFL